MKSKSVIQVPAMAFYHWDGFVPAWKQAIRFAGDGGRIATLPDIINARISTDPDSTAWHRYFTTTTAEYVGQSRGGSKIIIVAHGLGPMATLDGICKAYSYEYKDKSRNKRGGRISRNEFFKLEAGDFGTVEIIDYNAATGWNEYPFFHFMTRRETALNPLVHARLGNQWEEYLTKHEKLAKDFARENFREQVKEPIIIKMGTTFNCSYEHTKISDGQALAHLISIAQPMNYQLSQGDYPNAPRSGSLACEVDCHDWWNGVRLLGVRPGSIGAVCDGPDARQLMRKHWRELFEPSGLDRAPDGLFVLMQMPDKTWFTQITKKGASADSYEPEFRVTSMEKVGELARFYTDSNYPVPIFRYDRREAQAVLPKEANAYELVGDPTRTGGAGSKETCLVQGYRIEIDHTQRLIRQGVLANDYETLMRLIG
ncbi:MAG: hypothetical protein A3J76_01870 [Candidatus Moranbacteria bacterium RBG_13_45_13]|nr:MAG: hypothetical protein A3J76_01870 [Candidatus Moranbacteria bacterium RBG_13_45_13]